MAPASFAHTHSARGWADDLDRALESYQTFLNLTDLGAASIYSREDALGKLNKLVHSKKAKRAALLKAMGKKELMGTGKAFHTSNP
jgi:hypothetical protein